MIAGPSFIKAARAGPFEVTDDIAVRIEHADFRDGDARQLLLPARLPQQGFGPEHGGRLVVLSVDDRPRDVRAVNFFAHDGSDPLVSNDVHFRRCRCGVHAGTYGAFG